MYLGSSLVVDTFAEAFRLRYARLVVTAHDPHWLAAGLSAFCGYGTSVIGCDAEVGVEGFLAEEESPDGRPAARVLAFAFTEDAVSAAVAARAAQCLLTCPTVSVFDGLPAAVDRVPLGGHVRHFGDGYEKTKLVDGRRFWRIPVMDGECILEETVGVAKGVGGGNFILQASTLEEGLAAARRGVEAIASIPGTITPFPGGVVRSGSKVGSRSGRLKATTNEAFCPSLVGRPTGSGTGGAELVEGIAAALEIVIDGVDEEAVAGGMAAGIRAAAGAGIPAISAGHYGGKLGKFHFRLRDVLARD
jgi:formylmethanofuran--tetrahydromethanopterin N-formyltransferase